MGYYTKYELAIISGNNEVDHEYQISKALDYSPFEETCKWYGHEEDMKQYSFRYPDTIFELSGEGEESGDIWKKYYKNGKVQVCKAIITFDEFDESKLK